MNPFSSIFHIFWVVSCFLVQFFPQPDRKTWLLLGCLRHCTVYLGHMLSCLLLLGFFWDISLPNEPLNSVLFSLIIRLSAIDLTILTFKGKPWSSNRQIYAFSCSLARCCWVSWPAILFFLFPLYLFLKVLSDIPKTNAAFLREVNLPFLNLFFLIFSHCGYR